MFYVLRQNLFVGQTGKKWRGRITLLYVLARTWASFHRAFHSFPTYTLRSLQTLWSGTLESSQSGNAVSCSMTL